MMRSRHGGCKFFDATGFTPAHAPRKPSHLHDTQNPHDRTDRPIHNGYTLLRDAFPPTVAAAAREILWNELGLNPADPSGWTHDVVHLKKCFGDGPFAAALTERVWGAFDDLLGAGRYKRQVMLGWWPVSFPGFESPPWQPPQHGWHIDSPVQGLLPIFIFSDIGSGDGGTAFSLESHHVTARVLAAAEPAGLDAAELTRRVYAQPNVLRTVVEANGRAGDIVLLHPFMLHSRSPNTGTAVRFLCNPCISLYEPMNLRRSDPAEYSPVEQAIVNALAD